MISEQLNSLKKNKRTLIRKNRLSFSGNFDLSKEDLFEKIPIETKFTKGKSLNFDRHELSKNEEIKFNKKFSKFLKSLVNHMENPEIVYLLDYLIRIYSIDSFNTEELIFIILPFEKFEDQLLTLTTKYKSRFKPLAHSKNAMANIFVKDYKLFNRILVEYYSFYPVLKQFLTDLEYYLVISLKNSNTNYINEILAICCHLKHFNETEKIKKFCVSLESYFEDSEYFFSKLSAILETKENIINK